MKQSIYLLLSSLVFVCNTVFAQRQFICPFKPDEVITFCTEDNDLGISYEAGTEDDDPFEDGVACLGSAPSPAWFAMKINDPGDLAIKLTHSEGEDIDFICLGPFDVKTKAELLNYVCDHFYLIFNREYEYEDYPVEVNPDVCNNYPEFLGDDICFPESFKTEYKKAVEEYYIAVNGCVSKTGYDCTDYYSVPMKNCMREKGFSFPNPVLPDVPAYFDINNPCFRGKYDSYPSQYIMDCSYTTNSSEVCYIENAKPDQWYLLLITNFSQMPGTINFKKLAGSATTDCSVIVDPSSTGPYCEGQTIQLTVNNAPDDATFLWTGPDGFTSTLKSPTIPNAKIKNAGEYEVQMFVSGVASPVVPLTVDVFASDTVYKSVLLVEGETVTVDGHIFDSKGIVKFSDLNEHGCDSVTIYDVKTQLVPYLKESDPVCEGYPASISIMDLPDGSICSWNGPDGFSSTNREVKFAKVKRENAGTYTVQFDVQGIDFTELSGEIVVYQRDTVNENITIGAGETYAFNDKVLNKTGVYKAVLKNVYGCDSIVNLNLTVIEDSVEVMPIVPAPVLTPNGDGKNDVWQIENIELYPDAVVSIFDRFGKLLFKADKYNNNDVAWDGTYLGNACPTTDYWFVINIESIDRMYAGHFLLRRK